MAELYVKEPSCECCNKIIRGFIEIIDSLIEGNCETDDHPSNHFIEYSWICPICKEKNYIRE
jgi:hypothetical protein